VSLVAAGIAGGLVLSTVFVRLASRLLPLIDRTDPLAFTVVALLLAAIALWACYIPARRAMRIDPMAALRHE
jgi:ABC-type lipoprotein release transport system permease subunit